MFSLAPLNDLTRFRRNTFKNEVYLITEDLSIKCNGIPFAARSSKIEDMLEKSENIPVVEFSDEIAGLEVCLDLIYGGRVAITEDNFKTIYKFGMLFQICGMIEVVLAWIADYVTYDKFWGYYLDLKNLHEDINKSEFVVAAKRCLSDDFNNFLEHTTEICRDKDLKTIIAVMELLSRIDDIRVLSYIEDLGDTATKKQENVPAIIPSTDCNDYLQTVISSTVTCIENCSKSKRSDFVNRFLFIPSIGKVTNFCTNIKTLRNMITLLTNFNKITIENLNWEKELTSPTTSYDAIKLFTERAGKRMHPCLVVEIVLKWWILRSNTEHPDMSFIKPLITTILSVDECWYYSVCKDRRYGDLVRTLSIPEPTRSRYIYYDIDNDSLVHDSISKGDGTPVQLKDSNWRYSERDMERYIQRIPAFTYNTAVFPPWGDAKHHWYATTTSKQRAMFIFPFDDSSTHLSLLTDSTNQILEYTNADNEFVTLNLQYVPTIPQLESIQ